VSPIIRNADRLRLLLVAAALGAACLLPTACGDEEAPSAPLSPWPTPFWSSSTISSGMGRSIRSWGATISMNGSGKLRSIAQYEGSSA